MSKRLVAWLAICLMAAGSAHAQMGGGGGGGGRGGGGGGGREGHKNPPPSSPAPTPQANPAPTPRLTPVNKVEIVGVIQAIDPQTERITIAYEPVDALNWPAGTMPFVVAKTDVFKTASVGEKVRFHLESQQIIDLKPY